MTFLALTLFFIPALAYGADDSAEFAMFYDEALDNFVYEIRNSQREGAPFEPEVLACLHKQAQHLAAKVAHRKVAQLHGTPIEIDPEVDAHGWDECFVQPQH